MDLNTVIHVKSDRKEMKRKVKEVLGKEVFAQLINLGVHVTAGLGSYWQLIQGVFWMNCQ